MACDIEEFNRLKLHVAQLERERHAAVPTLAAPSTRVETGAHESSGTPNPPISQDTLSWRISAIEKFVPLSDEQKGRLRDKYERESAAKSSGEEVETESLDDILGADNASYYRQQVSAAFKKVQDEEIERESVWLSRKLELTPDQESSVRQIFERVESEIAGARVTAGAGLSPQERVRAMIAENRRRSELRNAELSRILNPRQLQTYAQIGAESSASDVEVFHDAGEGASQ
jgi:hypothetical protein